MRFNFWQICGLFLLLNLTACADSPVGMRPQDVWNSPKPPVYDYPFQDPIVATILTMPPTVAKLDYSDLPEPHEKTLTVFPGRQIPEGFWYERDGLRYGELLQDHAAPLVYVIAGTGADNRAEKMLMLGDILYSAGFHVVLLPSPTHPNFIINAGSDNGVVGRPWQSAQDLYRVMKLIDHDVTQKAVVTQRLLTGYSLGGLDAAFTADIDDQQHALNFKRVLLINPPLSLYTSIHILSDMLYKAMPNGIDNADSFLKDVMLRLRSVQQNGDPLDFSNERTLYDAYEKYKPSDEKGASLIGLSFRFSSSSLAFTTDVMKHSGYLFPKNKEFTSDIDLTRSNSLALRTSFVDYFEQFYVPHLRAAYPNMSREDMISEASLNALAPYMHNNPKFGLITNKDDIILGPGELDALAAIFGSNARIFTNGGHLGNLGHPRVGYEIVRFLRGGS